MIITTLRLIGVQETLFRITGCTSKEVEVINDISCVVYSNSSGNTAYLQKQLSAWINLTNMFTVEEGEYMVETVFDMDTLYSSNHLEARKIIMAFEEQTKYTV